MVIFDTFLPPLPNSFKHVLMKKPLQYLVEVASSPIYQNKRGQSLFRETLPVSFFSSFVLKILEKNRRLRLTGSMSISASSMES